MNYRNGNKHQKSPRLLIYNPGLSLLEINKLSFKGVSGVSIYKKS